MRKILSGALIVGLSFGLMGCPPAEKKGTDKPADPGTDTTVDDGDMDTDAGDGDATSKPADDGDTDAGGGETMDVDISHVKVGQKYHYHMNNAGMEMDQVWEVTEIGDAEIKYNLTTIMNGKALGEPTALTWAIPKPAPKSDAPVDPNAKPPAVETVTVAGKEWECWVVESAGTKSWCPKSGDMGTFPPIVKSMKGDQVTNELTKIE